jgi:N-acetyl-anhydromuramyl-L-alanine amidase AmpD
MMRTLIFLLLTAMSLPALQIKPLPIPFGEERIALTKAYIALHYGFTPRDIAIEPKIIVVHYTGLDDLDASLERFWPETLPDDRGDIVSGGNVNVSAHYLIDRDGTVFQLMPEDRMARHVIGLNHCSIGIENVGGAGHRENLTPAQLRANIDLISMLAKRHPGIRYLVGHYEYRCFEQTPLWLERDPDYRTSKQDPGEAFMRTLRRRFGKLKGPPCGGEND